MRVNWKVRMYHKHFWMGLLAGILVLANQIAGLFGIDITVYNEQITSIAETVFSLLAMLGIIIDPTTEGLSDSGQAMIYEKPRSDNK